MAGRAKVQEYTAAGALLSDEEAIGLALTMERAATAGFRPPSRSCDSPTCLPAALTFCHVSLQLRLWNVTHRQKLPPI
jgi:hypothetical protein